MSPIRNRAGKATPANQLAVIFASLKPPKNSRGGMLFSASRMSGYGNHRLAKDHGGHPALLIGILSDDGSDAAPPVILENLSVEHNVQCVIEPAPKAGARNRFTVVRLISSDPVLTDYFLDVVATLLRAIGPNPTRKAVTSAVGQLVDLFSALAEPPRKSIQGLWAELFVIAGARKPGILVQAWHADVDDRYDFSEGPCRLEIKSSGRRIREHYFTAEQCAPPRQSHALLASIFVEVAGAGTSVRDLVLEIKERLPGRPELALKLEALVAKTVGRTLATALQQSYDRELARQSLAYYNLKIIPRVSLPLPDGVREVHFLSNVGGLDAEDLRRWVPVGRLFHALAGE